MRLISLIIFAIVGFTIPCFAQTEKEVMHDAKREVLRRGAHVVATGTVRSGLVEQAFAPPADDSDKWHFTIIGENKDAKYEAMKAMLRDTKDPALLAWLDVKDQVHSKFWYHERVWDLKGSQADWLLPLKDDVEKYGLPLIVLQPCRNGRFGDPETVVKRFHGVFKEAELVDKIHQAVKTYVETIETARNPQAVAQVVDIGAPPPPFNVNPAPVPKTEERRQTFEFPDLKPPALTVDQVREACPGATPEFLLEVISAKESNVETVKLRWLVAQLKTSQAKPPIDMKPVPEDDGDIVPARPGAKDRSSFSLPSNQSPETTAMKLVGVFLVGMLAMKLMTTQWGTLIAVGIERRNVKDVATPRRSYSPDPMNQWNGHDVCPNNTTREPNDLKDATIESTRTNWRPSNVKNSEPNE